jgi:hypothetical protein
MDDGGVCGKASVGMSPALANLKVPLGLTRIHPLGLQSSLLHLHRSQLSRRPNADVILIGNSINMREAERT